MSVLKSLKELLRGMGITGKHLGRHAITIQYPEEKWEMPERSRGVVVLLSDKETGELNCTACELCMRACPTGAIFIDAPRGEDKKKHLKSFVVDNTLCCYCGLCEEACNFCAIKMAPKYEYSTTDRADLIWDMKKLQDEGRDVDYEDTRKKKPEKKADKPAPKSAEPKAEAPVTDEAKAEAKAEEPKPEKPKADQSSTSTEGEGEPKND